jgi:uncharacterized iron-regulated membrane protein
VPASRADSGRHGPAIGHRLKRWLFLVHRWIGIATCLLFAIWFVSGLVMIYVPYPSLSREERLAGLVPIDWQQVEASFPAVSRTAGVGDAPRNAVLEMRGDQPVWRAASAEGEERVVSAADARLLARMNASEAMRSATVFGRAKIATLERIERDQWTVAGGYDRHRPLWKAELAGPRGRVLYLSSATGAVVLDTDARERFWNWLGSIPHWIYFTELRKDAELWRQIVLWVSGPCMISGFTGLWIGVLRTRLGRRRFHGRVTPYRSWMEWHHIAGLIGGLLLTTWIFSGWLSVDPGRLFERGGIADSRRLAYERAGAPPALDLSSLAIAAGTARQVELRWTLGRPLLLVTNSGSEPPRVLDAITLASAQLDQRKLVAAARGLVPDHQLVTVERLTEPDLYWYEVGKRPLLPVLRLKFGDPAGTWVHIDPATGAILDDSDARARLYRWLYDLLHKWDLNLLTLNRPVWDLFLWFFSVAGLVTSTTGIKIGWARLRHRHPRRRPAWPKGQI